MNKESQSSGPIKAIRVIHIGILGSTLIFGGFIFLLVSRNYGALNLNDPLTYIPLTATVILIPLANFLFNKKLRSSIQERELKSKLLTFQSAHITRIALIEVLGFISVIISLVTNTLENYVIFILAIVYLIALFPTSTRIAERLELSQSERLQLEN
jgi:hypothetical protein